MRDLVINRRKTRLVHPVAAELWLEDADAPQQEIEGVGCRHLGSVRPGEKQSFDIPEQEARLFVQMDWHGQPVTAARLTLPEGDETLRYTGIDQMVPGQSRTLTLTRDTFSGENYGSNDTWKKYERTRKLTLIFCVIAGIALGLFLNSRRAAKAEVTQFNADGLMLTLSSSFAESGDRNGFDRAYYSNNECVLVARRPFADAQGRDAMTVEEFAAQAAQELSGQAQTVHADQLLTYFEYTAEDDRGDAHSYLVGVYRGTDAFWLVRFDCEAEDYADERGSFLQYAVNVTVP